MATAEFLRVGAAALTPTRPRAPRAPVDVITATIAAASLGAFLAFGDPLLLLVPLVPVATIAAARRPELGIGGALAVMGFQGTLLAHAGLGALTVANLLLLALWLGIAASYIRRSPKRPTWITPAMLLALLYVGVSIAQVGFSEHKMNALTSWRTSTYFLAAALLIALAPWSRAAYVRIAKAVAVVGLAVGAYAVFRFVVGPSAAEAQIALDAWTSLGRPASEEPQFYASFAFAPQLAGYAATLIPFLVALLVAGFGRRAPGVVGPMQLVIVAAVGTLAFALLASDNRTGLVAGIGGSGVVLALFAISAPFSSGRRIGTVAITALATVMVGAGLYTIAVTGQESRERYERLIDEPTRDWAYHQRLTRWEYAVEVASEEPFGHGLGTQGEVGESRPEGQVGPKFIDSSYLKIAIEQGFFVLGLYIAALLSLLFGLGSFARRARHPADAALAIGAAGTLTAAAILFYAGMSIEGASAMPLWILVGVGLAMTATRRTGRG